MAFKHEAVHTVTIMQDVYYFTDLPAAVAFAEGLSNNPDGGPRPVYVSTATKVTYVPDPEPLES